MDGVTDTVGRIVNVCQENECLGDAMNPAVTLSPNPSNNTSRSLQTSAKGARGTGGPAGPVPKGREYQKWM